ESERRLRRRLRDWIEAKTFFNPCAVDLHWRLQWPCIAKNTRKGVMAKKSPKQPGGKRAPAPPAGTVSAWEDDPATGVKITRPVPNLSKRPLAFAFPKPAPRPAIYPPGTPEFRYWTAAEALRRGADFWAARVPLSQWEVGPVLKVILDEGLDLNAYYDRKA